MLTGGRKRPMRGVGNSFDMTMGMSCPCISFGILLIYVVISLLLLSPPLHPVGSGSPDFGPRIRSAESVDAIVFVALGPAARSASLLYSVSSLREEGRWDGPIYVIVEHEDDLDCLASYLRHPVNTIATAGMADGDEPASRRKGNGPAVSAKMMKMRVLELLPLSIERVVYMDCDIITTKPVLSFLQEVGRMWREVDRKKEMGAIGNGSRVGASGEVSPHLKGGVGGLPSGEGESGETSTLLIFPDAAGHTVPVCRECDMAHSGVVSLARGHSERCLELWREAFLSGGKDGTGTYKDQEAMDIALQKGSGCEARWIGRNYLHFMKDPFVMLGFTRMGTFAHYTGLLKPHGLSPVHRRYYEWSLGRSSNEWGDREIKACAVE